MHGKSHQDQPVRQRIRGWANGPQSLITNNSDRSVTVVVTDREARVVAKRGFGAGAGVGGVAFRAGVDAEAEEVARDQMLEIGPFEEKWVEVSGDFYLTLKTYDGDGESVHMQHRRVRTGQNFTIRQDHLERQVSPAAPHHKRGSPSGQPAPDPPGHAWQEQVLQEVERERERGRDALEREKERNREELEREKETMRKELERVGELRRRYRAERDEARCECADLRAELESAKKTTDRLRNERNQLREELHPSSINTHK